jgi:hypothetical protein
MTFSKKFKPFMAYISEDVIVNLRRYSKDTNTPMSQLVREGISARITDDNLFAEGFNQGMTKAISVIHELKFAQMRFPSGASYAERIEDELVKHMWRKPVEEGSHESGSIEESM